MKAILAKYQGIVFGTMPDWSTFLMWETLTLSLVVQWNYWVSIWSLSINKSHSFVFGYAYTSWFTKLQSVKIANIHNRSQVAYKLLQK